ncbi:MULTISPECIES: hypothetical protein [Chryseobacterium]|uniref:hypothetical protein n=1 Tax=Chryseobacterium TaxID=59732 RepID=UPI000F94FE3C|nr:MULTISPECIES: hypothetical protein [Chryseobacterium]MBM7420647.1 hypothetical protein [Chryseobacterium sp. JUb44]MDH6210600.1 hypothetical protein [Chryseobacterium sp. BIGb0186]WSO09284.1 hypothetical protein VUJ64_15775 [Chryseobacterium scophthalmum]
MKYIVFLFLIISCGKNNIERKLDRFDISVDENKIVYDYKVDSLNNIYLMDISTDESLPLLNKSGKFSNPKFIYGAGKVVFINHINKPEFWIYDIPSKKIIKKITVTPGFIVDYFPSKFENKIYYIQASEFDSYSPIARKSFHDFDIYQLDLKSFQTEKLSNIHSYSMTEIGEINKDNLIVSMQGAKEESGLFTIDKKTKITLQNLKKISIENDTLRNSTMYGNPVILSQNKILCSSSYQLVLLNLDKKEETQILPSTGYHYRTIRNIGDKIFYNQTDNSNNITYFNLNDKKFNSINLAPKNIK